MESMMTRLQKDKYGGRSSFQMPLHYPKYTKAEYKEMQEWELDRLLAEYGLPVSGDLEFKRNFAIGAFLWSHRDQQQDPTFS